MKKNNLLFIVLILLAGIFRLIPHPWNLTPVLAACLFSGFKIKPNRLALSLPLIAIFLGDITLGFYKGMGWVYISYISVVALALLLNKKNSIQAKFSAPILGSFIFFFISNFGVWNGGFLYPKTFEGLIQCYISAIPFFKNTLIGTIIYFGIFFTISEYLEKSIFKIATSKN